MDAPLSRHPDLYTPLPTATSIRVIELHPVQKDDQPITCTLHLTDLEHNTPKFHALSYTWGDPLYRYWFDEGKSTTWVQEVIIICNGLRVNVTANLECALRAICKDKLCVNQDDVQERNTQVGLMARIYSQASLVISWLGPADEDSEQAIPIMRRLNKLQCFDDMEEDQQCSIYTDFMKKALEDDDKAKVDSISAKDFESLTRFLARKYFFRCWVLQEVMLARHIRMLCGTDILDFSELRRVALLVAWIKEHRFHETVGQALTLPVKNNRHYDHEKAILELFHNRWRLLNPPTTQEKTLPFTFAQLLALARMTGCEDPKDKVFALLGIVPRGAFGLTADYGKSPEQVYIEALRCLIDETKNLNCLSWVTDLSDIQLGSESLKTWPINQSSPPQAWATMPPRGRDWTP
ncbi:hypothetical protein J4E85_003079 [Alternaria conjuncta]|uniref:uncharacterized protein n=1 Tax=Alternaria conjuncta TaxID=181017 RepID=UPI00221F8B8E|nr:uncharacterized protein J4E85_003079 [Alternaria conjuncta]KAI4932681.1 hypothetical protein J4E85_003079 [Alternaria conjuncta]